ncbi:hypothetical protein AAMO2058_001171300 [Amorphochlora amoebiformis]
MGNSARVKQTRWATLRLLGTLAISTLVTGFIELVASKYASSVTLGADSLHMVLDAFVYTLNYIAEQKHQNLAQTKKHRQMLDDGRFCSNVFSDLSKETRKLLSEHSDVEQRSSLAQDELLLTLSPRSLQNDAIEAQMALNAVHWEVASSCVTGIVLLGSPLYIATVSVQKFLTAIQGPSHASIVEEKMDNSLLFYAGILGFCLHSIALVTFLFVPELQQLNPALILGRSIGHRDWDKGGGCHTDTHANALADEQMLGEFKGTSIQGLHLSATLFHILSDIMENLGLLVVTITPQHRRTSHNTPQQPHHAKYHTTQHHTTPSHNIPHLTKPHHTTPHHTTIHDTNVQVNANTNPILGATLTLFLTLTLTLTLFLVLA